MNLNIYKYKVLVNKNNLLDKYYIPKNLVIVNEPTGRKLDLTYQNKLDQKAYKHFKKIQKKALKNNYEIFIDSSYRSFEYQKKLFDQCVLDNSYKYALNYVALPGASEHQTGLAIDITIRRNNIFLEKITGLEEEIIWFNNNAYKYGFILRYPKGYEKITGYNYEPWHFRFVGKKIAKKMKKQNIKTLEEYLT